eukprot:CAMPEP_0176041152 /NCGR_PEP_ID=MMETSP0120_2-20121206/20410_1 /TAXON_ID=160619 /ORGANISM="Kryptoperidinium foliaceum, Strain CCMP 1326" /LENGTH=746 /DNA_ID=CAMNT_0017374553 /DNA_START=34 /DNA_END=2270 /DNA_ORIENTATION=-
MAIGSDGEEGSPERAKKAGLACLSESGLRDITAPKSLNGGGLEDVYKMRVDDFEEPQTLEVEYSDGRGGRLREIVFVDPVFADRRPRICVSVDGIQAMHNAISVLSRKVDNLVLTLKGCRSAYYKELASLKEQLYRQSLANRMGREYTVRDTSMFDAGQFETRSAQELERQVQEATIELEERLRNSQEEVKRLEKRVLILERESGRAALEPKRAEKDPREMMQLLLAMMNVDTVLLLAKQVLGDTEEHQFWEAVEGILDDLKGIKVNELNQHLEDGKKKMQNLELQLAKALDNKEMRMELDKLKRNLETESEKTKRLTTERDALAKKATDLQQAVSDMAKRSDSLTGENARLKVESEELKVQVDAERTAKEELESIMKNSRRGGTGNGRPSTGGMQAVPPGLYLKQTLSLYSPEETSDMALGIMRDLEPKLQSTLIQQMLKDVSSSVCLAVAKEVQSWTSERLPSNLRAPLASAMLKEVAEEDMTPVLQTLPNAAKKTITIQAINTLAAAAADSQHDTGGQRPQSGDSQPRKPKTPPAPPFFDPSRDLGKAARQFLIQRLVKSLKGEEVKALADRLPDRARRAMLTSIFEEQDPDDLQRCAGMLQADISLQAFASGLPELYAEKMAQFIAQQISPEALQRVVSGPPVPMPPGMLPPPGINGPSPRPGGGLAGRATHMFGRAMLKLQADGRDTPEVVHQAVQTDLCGTGTSLQTRRRKVRQLDASGDMSSTARSGSAGGESAMGARR